MMNGNGCTVYDSDGQIVYRVDNYAYRCSDEVYLMDHSGKTLTKILRKVGKKKEIKSLLPKFPLISTQNFIFYLLIVQKMRVFGQWEGYRYDGSMVEEKEPWFSVLKSSWIFKRVYPYEATVTVGVGSNNFTCYKIQGSACKHEYQIRDIAGGLVAEVRARAHTHMRIFAVQISRV